MKRTKKNIRVIHDLNKDFESRIRLGIMSVLVVNDWVDFLEMKELLQVTDGNLASHMSALEKRNYIDIKKEFVGKKTRTSYKITKEGRKDFYDHLNALEALLKQK